MICQDSYTYTQLEAPEVVLSNKGGSRIVANAFSRFLLGYWAAKTAYIRSTKRYFADVRTKLFSGAESCQISHLFCQWKINVTPWYACVGTEEGGGGGMTPSNHNPTLERSGCSAPRSLRFTPREIFYTLSVGGECGSGRIWTERKISPPPGFDPRLVQPAASSVPATHSISRKLKCKGMFLGQTQHVINFCCK